MGILNFSRSGTAQSGATPVFNVIYLYVLKPLIAVEAGFFSTALCFSMSKFSCNTPLFGKAFLLFMHRV